MIMIWIRVKIKNGNVALLKVFWVDLTENVTFFF